MDGPRLHCRVPGRDRRLLSTPAPVLEVGDGGRQRRPCPAGARARPLVLEPFVRRSRRRSSLRVARASGPRRGGARHRRRRSSDRRPPVHRIRRRRGSRRRTSGTEGLLTSGSLASRQRRGISKPVSSATPHAEEPQSPRTSFTSPNIERGRRRLRAPPYGSRARRGPPRSRTSTPRGSNASSRRLSMRSRASARCTRSCATARTTSSSAISVTEEDEQGVSVRPDCADLPYFLRAYFSFKLGLPFGWSRCSRGENGVPPTCSDFATSSEPFPAKDAGPQTPPAWADPGAREGGARLRRT